MQKSAVDAACGSPCGRHGERAGVVLHRGGELTRCQQAGPGRPCGSWRAFAARRAVAALGIDEADNFAGLVFR